MFIVGYVCYSKKLVVRWGDAGIMYNAAMNKHLYSEDAFNFQRTLLYLHNNLMDNIQHVLQIHGKYLFETNVTFLLLYVTLKYISRRYSDIRGFA